MLTPAKQSNMLLTLKSYKKKFLDRDLIELDESGTCLMINSFLSAVLGYQPIEEIKTEYMIKGTYADDKGGAIKKATYAALNVFTTE